MQNAPEMTREDAARCQRVLGTVRQTVAELGGDRERAARLIKRTWFLLRIEDARQIVAQAMDQ